MSSLSEVANQLRVQGDILGQQTNILEQIASSSQGTVKKMGFLEFMIERRKLKDLEAEREAGKPGLFSRMADKISGSGAGSGGKGFDLGNFLPAGGLFGAGAALAAALPKFLLGRALPALLAKAFADQIANYVESQTGSKEIGDAMFRGLQTGAIGLLLGKKIGLIAFLGGALFDEENRKKIEGILTRLRELSDKFNIKFPTFEGMLNSMTETLGEALDFVKAGFDGDVEGLKENALAFAGTLTALFALLRPGAALAVGLGTLGLAFGTLVSAGKGLAGLFGMAGGAGINKFTANRAFKAANTRDILSLTKDQKFNLLEKGYSVEGDKILSQDGKQIKDQTKIRSLLSGQGFSLEDDVAKRIKKPGFLDRYKTLVSIAKKVPALGTIISGGLILNTLLGDGSDAEKAKEIGGLLGGIVGASVAGTIGLLAGGPMGGVAGLLAGSFGGQQIGEALGNWLMTGNFVDPSDAASGQMNRKGRSRFGRGNNKQTVGVIPETQMPAFMPSAMTGATAGIETTAPTTAQNLSMLQGSDISSALASVGGGVNVIDTSTTNIGSTQSFFSTPIYRAGIYNMEA